MRNIKLDGRSMHTGGCRVLHWPEQLPTKGMLSCDFTSLRTQKTLSVRVRLCACMGMMAPSA